MDLTLSYMLMTQKKSFIHSLLDAVITLNLSKLNAFLLKKNLVTITAQAYTQLDTDMLPQLNAESYIFSKHSILNGIMAQILIISKVLVKVKELEKLPQLLMDYIIQFADLQHYKKFIIMILANKLKELNLLLDTQLLLMMQAAVYLIPHQLMIY